MPAPSASFVDAVHALVADIPEGCALSYGEVAAMLGSRAPRAVGWVMAHSEGLPWWRVVRASGEVVPELAAAALDHYRVEGTPLRWAPDRSSFRVDLRAASPGYFFDPFHGE